MKRLVHKFLFNPFGYSFSSKQRNSKIESVGFKKNAIHDLNKISYFPKESFEFVDGKALMYKYRRTLFEAFYRSSFYTIPISLIGLLIKINPFATFFPAAIPILYVFQLILFKLFLTRIKWNKKLVEEIYLLENGQVTEVHYCNKLKRKLFGQPLHSTYYNSVFVNPNFEEEETVVLETNLFPEKIQNIEKSQNLTGYTWTKHFSNGENFLLIPKKAQFMNKEVLIQIFKGKVIRLEN